MDGADGMPMGAANSTLNMSHMDNSASGLNQVPTVYQTYTNEGSNWTYFWSQNNVDLVLFDQHCLFFHPTLAKNNFYCGWLI